MATQFPRKRPHPLHLFKKTETQNPNHYHQPCTYLNTLTETQKPKSSPPNLSASVQLCYHQYNSLKTNQSLPFHRLIMENFRPPFTPSATTSSSSSSSSSLESSSSLLFHDPMVCYLPSHPHWQQPPHSPYFPPVSPFPVPSSTVRDTRMVRQRRSNILRSKKASRAAAASSRLPVERDPGSADSETQNEQHLYSFYTLNNKKLRLLLKKELKNSDVGSLGRIVLPKKEAEKYLPRLSDKDGIELRIRDALSTQEWGMRYKYWTNNKSRMYVLENAGEFVRQSGVEVGDSIHLYEDECKNLYVSVHWQAGARPEHEIEPSSTSYHQQNYIDTSTNPAIDNTKPYAYNETRIDDEDETSAAVLLQQQVLEHKAQLAETNNLVTLSTDLASSYRQSEEASNSNNNVTRQQQSSTQPAMAGILESSSMSLSSPSIVKKSEDNFWDCYEGLETLPDVHGFEHSLFYFDNIMRDDKTL